MPGYIPQRSDPGFKFEFFNLPVKQNAHKFSEGSLKVSC